MIPRDYDALFRRITEWADKTFPGSRMLGKALHLKEEAGELVRAVEIGGQASIADELADVFLIAIHLASQADVDVYETIERKFQTVQQRKWLPPDAYGVVRHDRRAR